MPLNEFANGIASKKYVNCEVVKNEGDIVIVSIKQNYVLSPKAKKN